MSTSPTTKAPAPVFTCDCNRLARSACNGLHFFKEHEGKRYCVLHYPGKDKVLAFNEVLKAKLDANDFNFRGVWFPEKVNFSFFKFDTPAYFTYARFQEGVNFGSAVFSGVAYFSYAAFSVRANFDYATFERGVIFLYATFSVRASFKFATFKDYVRYAGYGEEKVFGSDSLLDLEFASIEKPERLSLHALSLRPHWFVNVDARKFELINVDWNWQTASIRQEVDSINNVTLYDVDVLSRHRLLAVACRNLAVNAEENHRYEESSRFRYMAMEARRLERWRGFAPWTLGWWYWLASGYGERVWRAFVVLLGVWLLAGALYTQVGFVRWEPRVSSEREAAEAVRDDVGAPLRWQRALTYSLGVMTLQKPEPRPATNAAQALVMLEMILGPVQAALLALAIRRKFMR